VKKIAQNVAKQIFLPQLMHNFTVEIFFQNFESHQKTAQSKQSPNGRKLAESGHPGPHAHCAPSFMFCRFSPNFLLLVVVLLQILGNDVAATGVSGAQPVTMYIGAGLPGGTFSYQTHSILVYM
jgi:hypothetical protein